MHRPMTAIDLDITILAAVYKTDAFQSLTPGMFAELFGVPSSEQLTVLREVIYFDVRCRVCAIASAA